jgi:hypothetical protein
VKYHFRAVVDVPTNKYSIYVTPAGQDEITIGTDFSFRSEQAGIASLDHWDAISQVGTLALCNLVIDTAATQGSVRLLTTALLYPVGDGSYQAVVTVRNSGTGTAQNIELTNATLGSATGTPSPSILGDIQPGGSVITTVIFPAFAGAPGTTTVARFAGIYQGGSFATNLRVTLPTD